jgi:hypothetical protein
MPVSPPDIEGLNLIHDYAALGAPVVSFGATRTVDPDSIGPYIECGNELIHIACPGSLGSGDTYDESFTIPEHWSTGAILVDDIIPRPDFALVQADIGFSFEGSAPGCDGPFTCSDVVRTDVDIFLLFTGAAGDGTTDWHPAGFDPNPPYAPGMAPGGTGSWTQGGHVFFAPPATVYTDPDPLDPSIDFVPYLWNWDDVVGSTFYIFVPPGGVHARHEAGGPAWELVVTPYRRIRPAPSTNWMQVL